MIWNENETDGLESGRDKPSERYRLDYLLSTVARSNFHEIEKPVGITTAFERIVRSRHPRVESRRFEKLIAQEVEMVGFLSGAGGNAF